ncbi:glycosyltransferase [Vibrio vulnificus]|uniref:glycosyltransferase family 2 protein n=1 Tax=Vibrio vulnificus TaxID=672 RepID=UPI0024DF440C|nr:glycosyltransferase family 2 protein [Vibrio vulnificus]MDK2638476.1 glycosyltransferase [Vibrio vulnificus]MDK2646832.1 glycosyltransferase [Vibrio vulnificus]MDK2664691.1 glycosyltransferase [Vibrio vulnificus]MDK2690490.1 glycosyltransferase [Vibrio vulnificus]
MLKEKQISISVVVTNYNKDRKLTRCYLSIIEQLEEDDELLIIDDCSTNLESKKILDSINHKQLRIIENEENMGVSFSKNKGVFLAKNDAIVLVDADDWLPNNSLSLIRKSFTENPHAWLIFGDYFRVSTIDESIVDCSFLYNTNQKNLDQHALAKDWLLLGVSPFRRSKCFSICSFDTRFNRTDDVDFHRRIITTPKFEAAYINAPIYVWDCQEEGNNSNIPNKDILFSQLSGFLFYYKNLKGWSYIKFVIKLVVRFLIFNLSSKA